MIFTRTDACVGCASRGQPASRLFAGGQGGDAAERDEQADGITGVLSEIIHAHGLEDDHRVAEPAGRDDGVFPCGQPEQQQYPAYGQRRQWSETSEPHATIAG
ncbi:hypothetical protein ACIRRA_17030 [Nocardia sp. NPDC101769]|uniref:hypothetical protein n=1 Tax=Nocardia sp. NPDC101769 TaxID=3364333 RepID=UPI0037F180EC